MSTSNHGWTLAVLGLCGLVPFGCLDSLVPQHTNELAPSVVHAPHIPGDAFVTLNAPADMHAELCDLDGLHPKFPDGADTLTRVFCQDFAPGGKIPTPTSLDELLKLLGLDFKDPNGGNGVGGNPGFALLGHSSALTARKVSSIAPTAFIFTPPPADGSKPSGYVFLAYDPGETFVEVASHDPTLDVVNFYLVMFDKECTNAPGGCKNTDLLTQNLTKGWSNLRQYESSTALNNTIADCRQCHAPDDSKDQILRMQENTAPFTHWFSTETDGGRALFQDFHAAHGTSEDYGPIPAALIDKSDPAKMAQMIKQAGFAQQPNAFYSKAIEEEDKAWASAQPAVNVPTGWSVTWEAAYDKAVSGQFIAAPYHDVKVTDPAKLAGMTDLYKQWTAGTLQGDLPDIRDVFLDEGLRDMGFAAKRGLDGKGLLVQLCQQCHNTLLDPTITRDKFLVDRLDQMSRDEKNLAIERMSVPDTGALFMPPRLFRTMTDQERDLMIAELKK
jgi:hypothetical protein